MSRRIHVDETDQLSLQAVGLWRKLNHLYKQGFVNHEVMTVHPDPNAWGPFDEKHDLEAPLDELLALSYVDEQDGIYRLHQVIGDLSH